MDNAHERGLAERGLHVHKSDEGIDRERDEAYEKAIKYYEHQFELCGIVKRREIPMSPSPVVATSGEYNVLLKAEAQAASQQRDREQIRDVITRLDKDLRSSYQGQAISLPVSSRTLPNHVIAAVAKVFEDAGWAVLWKEGYNDQRDGEGPGHFTFS